MQNLQPVFILGNPRSGTSLFRIILDNHPNIVSPPECGFAHWWLLKYGNWKQNDLYSFRLDQFLNDLFHSKKFETWNLDQARVKKIILENQPENYGDLVSCVYLSYSNNEKNIKIVSDKNNYYIKHIKELNQIWPNAKYLHVIRDGRDVACSYKDLHKLKSNSTYKPQLSVSIEAIASEWADNNKLITSLLQEKDYQLIKYEDLILKTPEVSKTICEFLNIKYSKAMLDYYKNDKENEPQETLDWKKRTLEKPDTSRIGRYRNELSSEEIELFFRISKNSLNFYGYE